MIDDSADRAAIRDALDESMLVEAAAGTGKTSELVRRIVRVLETGRATVDRVVAVTFTRKAAGELKLRLRAALDQARVSDATDDVARARFETAIAHLEEARIGTIHSFCADLLRERPVEARIDPDFVELREQEDQEFFRRVFRAWLQERLAELPPGLRRALGRSASAWRDDPPLERLASAAWTLAEWRDHRAPWRREPFDREDHIDRLALRVAAVAAYAARASSPTDDLVQALEPAVALRDLIAASEQGAGAPRDHDALEGQLVDLAPALKRFRRLGRTKRFGEGLEREEVKQARAELIAGLERFARDVDADLASHLREELIEVVDRYDAAKRAAGRVDFVDLLLLARDLVRDHPETRAHLQSRFTHLFVDEFQDTDPLQAELLLLLAADDPAETDWRKVRPRPGKLFLVGDPKQSIYRFRRADLAIYGEVKEQLEARGVRVLHLGTSWRALGPIQALVNTAFASEMKASVLTGSPDYVPLSGGPPSGAQPSLVVLPAPYPYGQYGVSKADVARHAPETTAAFIEWLLASGWKIRDPETGERIAILPRHVAVLFRRFTSFNEDVARPYVVSLEARGIPHVLYGSRSFHRREEVEVLRAAASAIEWPEDELSVYATLRGALFGFDDASLLAFRQAFGPLDPARRREEVPAEPPASADGGRTAIRDFAPIDEALSLLRRLHNQRNRAPIVRTLSALLEATRAHAMFALWPAGDQVLGNVGRVLDLARAFETAGGLSFRGFVERLDAEAERARSAEAPVVEEGAEGVRIMTVHNAKGLEFPIVILADITAPLAHSSASRYADPARGLAALRILGLSPRELLEHGEDEVRRDEAEGLRLAYVAATRARDLLVVHSVGIHPMDRKERDFRSDGWVGPLEAALFPSPETWRRATPASGCPAFGLDTVLAPAGMDAIAAPTPPSCVQPGAHLAANGAYEVVWWDPRLLVGTAAPLGGLANVDALVAERSPEAADRGRRRFRTWADKREAMLERGRVATHRPFIATAARHPPEPLAPLSLVKLKRKKGRPGGARFGSLVHAVLAQVELGAPERVPAIAQLNARLLDAPIPEVRAAIEAVGAALEHPILLAAARAEPCHREYPIAVPVGGADGDLLEGDIDLVYRDGDEWIVVDYKTDLSLDEIPEAYARQLGWYCHAIRALFGGPVRGVLLAL